MLITRSDDLKSLVSRLRAHGSFALDTEFERERSYWPKLQLIQVSIPGEVAAIDPLEFSDLEPMFEILKDPDVQKVMHAGRQDAEIFFNAMGSPPRNIYDTQVAAALVGLGEQIGYANLVNRLKKVRIKKTERVTDWGRRPLTDLQLNYALDDVRYLLELRDELNRELTGMNRAAWLQEELAFYDDPEFYVTDPSRIWSRVSGWRSLDRRGVAVLRELANWREKAASERDQPRNRVAADDVLLEIASRQPTQVEHLTPLRRLHSREIERSGKMILAAVAKGMSIPESELPQAPRPIREDQESALVSDLMNVLLRKRARENKIATAYLANSKGISAFVAWLSGSRTEDPPPIYTGWRRELVGNDLAAVYEGKTGLRVDPTSRKVSTVNHEQ